MWAELPAGLTVFERGWLSSNNVLCVGESSLALVDSGYCTHSDQTLALVEAGSGARPLSLLVNTHLHSDHCGGNSALQLIYPDLVTLIPPGAAAAVRDWAAYEAEVLDIGQQCPRFVFQNVLRPGHEVCLGDLDWQIHASPGHDHHSVILFHEESATLISADALWENGFGVVFSHIQDGSGFDEVAATLDLIETLGPRLVIPGHGKQFSDVASALAAARRRLNSFVQNPHRHALHAAKVLVKFKLLEVQSIEVNALAAWADQCGFFRPMRARYFSDLSASGWISELVRELERSGAARIDGVRVFNT